MAGHYERTKKHRLQISERTLKDLTGQKFNRLLIIRHAGHRGRRILWLCHCDCGKQIKVLGEKISSGRTKSCGCLNLERVQQMGMANKTHGQSAGNGTKHQKSTRTYNSWTSMNERCLNPNAPNYRLYGGRGVKVCKRWRDFKNFLSDMGERPIGRTLDRIDSDGNYEPSNCRWSTPLEQTNNRRCSKPKLGFKMTRDKPIPDAIRREVLHRAGGYCEECGERVKLELHHLTYVKNGDHDPKYGNIPIFGYETADDLRALCRNCHHDQHIGPDDVFYTDPEECAAEWDYYDHMMISA